MVGNVSGLVMAHLTLWVDWTCGHESRLQFRDARFSSTRGVEMGDSSGLFCPAWLSGRAVARVEAQASSDCPGPLIENLLLARGPVLLFRLGVERVPGHEGLGCGGRRRSFLRQAGVEAEPQLDCGLSKTGELNYVQAGLGCMRSDASLPQSAYTTRTSPPWPRSSDASMAMSVLPSAHKPSGLVGSSG